jgi:hypothetical protein
MRRVVVLEETAEDIECGRVFYDLQEIGVGEYFEDTIWSDIESLRLFHGVHAPNLARKALEKFFERQYGQIAA